MYNTYSTHITLITHHTSSIINTTHHSRFGSDFGSEFWEEVNLVFDCLPPATTIGMTSPTIFGVHGGIGQIQDISQIKSIPRPIQKWTDNEVLLHLVWSDPARHDDVWFIVLILKIIIYFLKFIFLFFLFMIVVLIFVFFSICVG